MRKQENTWETKNNQRWGDTEKERKTKKDEWKKADLEEQMTAKT